ncbi:hypothetical protein M8C13_00010 [Crossiella sp. SN42]|uniref:hypothetical protein n=1 Tax=Crossiella sp. SN42 TaxID=2944808 RepID=UPI00207CC2EA|nr:hypothetical protein [Crossiella sp. SN42]MCO1574141.1 hypothetical protein [Crossiella sp. SN42]
MSWLTLADLTGDGIIDIIASDPAVDNGTLTPYPGDDGITRAAGGPRFDREALERRRAAGPVKVGAGWNMMDVIFLNDVNLDGWLDLVGKVKSTGELRAYPHSRGISGTTTWGAPQLIGRGWGPHDVIS